MKNNYLGISLDLHKDCKDSTDSYCVNVYILHDQKKPPKQKTKTTEIWWLKVKQLSTSKAN